MDPQLQASELILNQDGSIYHLHLRPGDIADKIFLVGDPGRVKKLSSLFDTIEVKVENREFLTHTGYLNGTRVSALSTGIGTDNIDIVVNELDALFNIDFKTREIKPLHKSLDLIRIGTTGGLQKELKVGSFVLTKVAAGFDGLLHYYGDGEKVCDQEIEKAFTQFTSWQGKQAIPYFVHASDRLFNLMNDGVNSGITISAPGFYAPQGRMLRLPVSLPDLNDKITDFRYGALKILNYEMESSALLGLSSLLGHEAVAICAVIANRITGEFIHNYDSTIKALLEFSLERIISRKND